MGQIYNVLIIVAIALLMSAAMAAIAYFADLLPAVIDRGTQVASNISLNAPLLD